MFNRSGRFRIEITEIVGKHSARSHVQREGTRFDLCPSASSSWVRVPVSVQMSCSRAGPPAPLALTMGTQARRGWVCRAGWDRGQWVLPLPAQCSVGMPCLSPVWFGDSAGRLQPCQQHPCHFSRVFAAFLSGWTVCTPGAVLALPGVEGWGGKGETFMETGDLCPLSGGNGGCHGDSFSK